ncbi:MAG: hypothetical protein M0R06_03025 [Sphaerochaeta sp.]|jgi:ribosomal protein L34E|nr:hypothetical protein [Sphaerochaeta sp.]
MKNKAFSGFDNRWPKNPTQNAYRRAIKTPGGKLESDFTRKQAEFERMLRLPDILRRGVEDD